MPNCNTRKGDLHILMLVAISLVSSLAFQRTWLLECALILVAACCHVSFKANLIGLSWNAGARRDLFTVATCGRGGGQIVYKLNCKVLYQVVPIQVLPRASCRIGVIRWYSFLGFDHKCRGCGSPASVGASLSSCPDRIDYVYNNLHILRLGSLDLVRS